MCAKINHSSTQLYGAYIILSIFFLWAILYERCEWTQGEEGLRSMTWPWCCHLTLNTDDISDSNQPERTHAALLPLSWPTSVVAGAQEEYRQTKQFKCHAGDWLADLTWTSAFNEMDHERASKERRWRVCVCVGVSVWVGVCQVPNAAIKGHS